MKMKTKLLAALVALVLALGAHAELCVSEICPKPKGFDPNGFESGWIELYNAGDEPVNLSSYTLERFNRGKAAKAGSYAALPDVTVPAKGYQVVYTSEEYPAAVNDGKTPFVYEGCVVVPFKVNPKKYPLVRLLKGADVLESFVVPVELDNDKSFAPAGGVFPEYTAPGVQPALPQPPAAVEIAVDPTKVTTDEAKGVTAVDAAASLAETNIWSLAFTFRIPTTEIPSVKTGYPLFNAPGAIYAYLDPDGQIEFQVGSANFQVDFDGIWTDNEPHTVQFVCGPLADSRIAIAVDGVTYVDCEVGVAAPLDATKSLLFGQITDAGEWMSFAGNISDVKLYTGSLIHIDYTEAVVSDEKVAVPAAVTRVILPKPTKGAANNMTGAVAYGPNAGPLYGVKHALADWKAFAVATKGADYAIEMMVNPLSSAENDAIQNVTLVYRAFAAKDMTLKQLPMTVKTTGDKSAGTTYEATVPAADLPEAGGLLQWAAIVTDKAGNSWRTPSARSEENGYKWYGTIVEPTEDQVSATLPTWHFFCEQDTLDNMDKQKENIKSTHPNGVFCGIYDSQTGLYYDHVRIDLRGNTTAGLTKKSHSLKFLKCQPLTCTNPFDGEAIECRKTSMLAEYADPSRLRSCLSFYLRRQAGQDVPFCYPIRTQLNGKFYQLCFHTNRFKDELFEDYFSGYDPMGHAFKNAGDCDSTYCGGGVEQQLPDPDDYPSYLSEFNAFKSQFVSYVKKNHPTQSGMTDADRKIVDKVVVKDFDLPGWLNFLALSRLTQECDDGWSTLCLYYDVNRTGTWTPMAYDVHQSFGAYYKGDGYGVAGPWADNDRAKCHPYYGGMRVVSGNYSNNINRANRAYECIYQSPKFRRLMARRLRTLMDDLLKEPGTAQADTPFWNDYAAKLVEAMQADDVLDRQKWGLGTSGQLYVWSGSMSFADGVKDLWDNYIVKRRTHFFTTHSAANTAFSGAGYGAEYNAMLPAKQSELAVLKPQFEVVNQNVDGTFTDTEKLVIRNNNDEAVDLSGWKVEGVLKLKLPAGTVVDAKDTITIVSDRKAYVAKNDASLADQVIVGNAAVNADATTVALKAADGTEVVACAEPTDEAFYLRLHSFYGNTADGDKGDSGEWICLTNISPTAQLNLNGVKIEFTKQGDTESKCLFTITNDIAIAAGGSVTLKQKDYKAAGWSKITNNKLAIAITDRNGGTCQAGTVTQSNHPKADGNGAYLILNTTARSFTDEDFSESSLLFLSAAADVSGNAATVVATVDDLGEGATACDLYFACGPKAEELPAATLVASGLGKGAVWTNALEDLAFSTDYKYLYVASNNAPAAAGVTAGGTFATEAAREKTTPVEFGDFQSAVRFTVSGYAGAETLTDYPVLVRLAQNAPEGFDYAECAAGGADIRFADAEGNVLAHEIETWNPNGESCVWVKVSALMKDTVFLMYYNGTSETTVTSADTWSAYTGVWHMDELDGDVADATGHGLTAKPMGAAASKQSSTDGVCGKARINSSSTAAGDKAYLNVPSYDDFKLGSTFTMSGWVKMSACTSYPRIFSRKANWGDANGWEVEMNSGSMTDFQARGAAQENFAATFSPALNAGFSQVVFVYNDKTLDVYQNGVLLKSGAITAATDNGKPLSFGSDSDGNETHIAGTFDEFRLADGCASADRIKADYDQLAVGGAAFLTASAALKVATDEPVLARPEATASFETAEVRTSLRLVGTGATKATVSFAYGTDASNLGDGEVIATDVAAEGAVVANLADLTPGTTYYYVFRAVNDAAEPMTGTLLGSFQTKAFGIPEIADEFVNGSESVQEIATVVNVGDGAASVDISFAHGADLDHLSAFELIRSGATAGEKATATITDFEQGVAVAYAWLVVSDKAVTNRVTGSFTPGIDFRRPDTTIAEYSRGVKMTVSGYTEGEALENFPVLVRLSEGKPAGFSYADFYSTDGSDLVFIDAKGKVLAHEVDTWNPKGESLVWVQIPELSKDVEFSMWYRSSKPGSVFKADPMWAAYVGVWHLGEGGDGVQAVADSAVNALNGTTHANSLAQPNGVIGAARRVSTKGGNSGANGQILVELNEAQQTTLDDMMPTFTFSAWFAFRTTTGPDYAFLCSSKDNDKDPGWGIQFNAAANGTPSTMRVHSSGAADNQCATYTKTISKEVWYKMNMVWDGTTFRAYYDGVQAATGNLWNNKEAVMGKSGRISFGGMTGSGYGSFNGDMDEIRIRKGASSAAWVKAEYLNETTGLITSGEVVSFTEKPKPVGTLALVDFGAAFAQFGGSLTALGGEATAAEIQAKVWAAGDEEPAEWTTLATGVTAGAPFSGTVTGLRPMTAYAYQIRAVSDLAGANPSDVVEGTFTTVGTGAAGQGGKVSLVGDDYVHVYDRHSKDLTFVPPEGVSAVELLLVGGGGAGGHTHGGGGAGGSVTALDAVEVEPGAEYAIEIGAGGIASAAVGTASTAGGATVLRQGETVVAQATGGNAGGNNTTCDGGDNANFMGGVKNTGGNSGGGGAGAGQVGGAASNDSPPSGGTGGNGFTSSITGTAVVYGGGGGGGTGTQGTLTNPSSPGAGGLGGGGKGGGGNVAVEADAAPTAGQDGLGGGGGGGAVSIAAYLAGCNGGSGFAAIRYTMAGTGAGTAVPRVSIDSATYDGDLKITVGYRVGWAGEGVDKAAVRLLWGYTPTAITREVAVSEATIGSGSFVFSAPLDQTTYYFKVVASNAAGSDESDATLSVVVPKYDGDVPGDQQVPAFEGDVALGHADGHFATLEGLVKSLGEGATSATVTGYIGLTDDVAEMTNQVAVAVAEGEPFAYPLTGLDLDTTYYCYVEVRNDLGAAISTPVMSFTTRSASALSTPAVTSSQNAVTLRGSLLTVGAGVTDVYVAWNGGAYEKVASFTGESESTEFVLSYAIAEWKNVSWKVLCSNECVTVAGEPTGEFWTDLRQATQVLTDTATYTWKPDADGNWSGDWSDPAHWDSNKDVCLGYPNSASAAVTFANCTAANPVTVQLDKGYACGAFTCIGTAASDITFAGPGAANCTLTCGALPQKGAFKSGTKLAFRDLTFKSNNGSFVIAEKNNDVSGLEIVFSGVTVPPGSISQFVVAAPYSHVTFERHSSIIFGDKLSVGGTNSVLTVDDSAVQATPFYAPVDIDGDGMKLEIRGANPVLKSTGYFSTYANTEDLRIVFTIPEGGYAAAPIQMTGTLDAHKFALPPMAQGSSKYLIEFDPASPALAVTNEITDMVLVDTKKGFATDYMAEDLGIAPVDDKGAALGAYKLSEDGLKLLVTFRGYEHGGPWQDIENAQVEGVTDENKAAVEATLDAILDAIPDGDCKSVAQYLTDAYGDQKVPAAKIANAKNIGLSVKYLIPLMEAEKPTIEVEADVENDAGFVFVIKDGATPVELNATKAKVREIVRFAADLATSEFAPDTTETEIAITVEGSAIKASFKKPNNETQGFMKAVMD